MGRKFKERVEVVSNNPGVRGQQLLSSGSAWESTIQWMEKGEWTGAQH